MTPVVNGGTENPPRTGSPASPVADRPLAELLSRLAENIQCSHEVDRNMKHEKRASERYRLCTPVWIRPLDESGPHPARGHRLCDISDSGLAFISKRPFEPGQIVLADLCVDHTKWGGKFQVVYHTGTGDCRMGLRLSKNRSLPPDKAAKRSDHDPLTNLRKLVLLNQARDEIRQALRAYRLAHRTRGLLGTPMKRGIVRILKGLSPAIDGSKDDRRRKHTRLRVEGNAHLVFPMRYGWQLIHAWALDVSQSGLRVLIDRDRVDDCAEHELTRRFQVQPHMLAIVGFGAPWSRLWVPGETVHCIAAKETTTEVGVRFSAEALRKAFAAAQ